MSRNASTCDRTDAQRAFTLVELLVVITIVGAMLSLTVPAIQNARESARRVHCKNNLKQLSIACFSHHNVHRWFPTGGWG